jgi:hypothetical protein
MRTKISTRHKRTPHAKDHDRQRNESIGYATDAYSVIKIEKLSIPIEKDEKETEPLGQRYRREGR